MCFVGVCFVLADAGAVDAVTVAAHKPNPASNAMTTRDDRLSELKGLIMSFTPLKLLGASQFTTASR
jgi:hypothetical protein